MMKHSRASILERLRAKVARGEPIIGGGAGTGISAKCEEAGGIDLIVVYNSGRFRMAGRGSLAGLMPFGNANQIVREHILRLRQESRLDEKIQYFKRPEPALQLGSRHSGHCGEQLRRNARP